MGPVQEGTLPFVARGRHLLSYRHFHTERWYIRAISQGNDKQASLFCFFSLLSHLETRHLQSSYISRIEGLKSPNTLSLVTLRRPLDGFVSRRPTSFISHLSYLRPPKHPVRRCGALWFEERKLAFRNERLSKAYAYCRL